MQSGEKDEELEKIRQKIVKEIVQKKMSLEVDKPVEVTDSNFDIIIKNSRIVVIDCWAPWCAPCRMMAPIIDELAKEYAGRILFGKLNVDKNSKTPAKYQIMSIPTFLVFKEGVFVERIVGAIPKKALEQRLIKYVSP